MEVGGGRYTYMAVSGIFMVADLLPWTLMELEFPGE